MPKAVADTSVTKRVELKTAPPDGYVVLAKLSYGELRRRTKMMTNLEVKGGSRKERNDVLGVMNMANEAVSNFEFATCIKEHNLEDEDGRLLNFSRPADIDKLDPKVGQEIAKHINEMNSFDVLDDEEEMGNSGNGSELASF